MLKPTCIHDLELGVTLGTGSFGRVRFCTHIPSNQFYAIKILKKSGVFESRQVSNATLFIVKKGDSFL